MFDSEPRFIYSTLLPACSTLQAGGSVLLKRRCFTYSTLLPACIPKISQDPIPKHRAPSGGNSRSAKLLLHSQREWTLIGWAGPDLDGRTGGRRVDGGTGGWLEGRADRRTAEGRTDGRTGGRTDGWMGGRRGFSSIFDELTRPYNGFHRFSLILDDSATIFIDFDEKRR